MKLAEDREQRSQCSPPPKHKPPHGRQSKPSLFTPIVRSERAWIITVLRRGSFFLNFPPLHFNYVAGDWRRADEPETIDKEQKGQTLRTQDGRTSRT